MSSPVREQLAQARRAYVAVVAWFDGRDDQPGVSVRLAGSRDEGNKAKREPDIHETVLLRRPCHGQPLEIEQG
jgi:hypothetical protein